MCGIAGYSHSSRTTQPEVLISALDSIRHRGPDHHGHFFSDQIAIGATRLRILDLASGDQPLFSPDGNVVVVFNGEIFNHRELRQQLEGEGFKFETHCDTEVILNAFLHWGSTCFSRLRGMFAIAIWIQSEHRLLLVRDRMGIKPLYYCEQNGQIYFGSELKCILAHPSIERHISLQGLNCFLSLNYVPSPWTLVEGILKLEPGHLLEWHNGECKVRSYTMPVVPPRVHSMEDACQQLDVLIDQSVREQLVSDVPLGVWLSGGLDSSTILYYASRLRCGLHTYSVTFQGRSFDESRYIREVSQHFGTQHAEFDLSPNADLADTIEEMAYYSDEPSADAGALPLWYLARMSARGVTVLLSGEGADELFAGYLTYRADRYASSLRKVPPVFRRLALALASRLPVSDDKISFEYKLKRFLQGSLLSPERAHVFWNGTFSEKEKRDFFHFARPEPLDAVLAGIADAPDLQGYLDFDQRYYLPDDILYKVDRISMAHSIEARPPFLDPRIVDFANYLPEQLKLRGATSKFVLRSLMRDKLPDSVLQRPKVGFDIPIHDWFRGVLRPLLLDTLSMASVTSTGLFRWRGVEHLLRQHLNKRANLGYHLWGLTTLLLWMKRWKIELAAERPAALHPVVRAAVPAGSSSQRLASFSS
jgi:asparagine synthase (glutamine-hydrolysing)